MDEKDTNLLKSILAKKHISLITNSERIFLKARREYLNDDQRKKYADIIGVTLEEDLVKEEEVQAEGSSTYNQLLEYAKSIGYKGKRIPKEELVKWIESNQ